MRVFLFQGKEYPDPGEQYSDNQIRTALAGNLPALANCEAKRQKELDEQGCTVVEFVKKPGTLGAVAPKKKRALQIVEIWEKFGQIQFEAEDDLVEQFRVFGTVGKATGYKHRYLITVDALYDFDEVLEFLRSFGGEFEIDSDLIRPQSQQAVPVTPLSVNVAVWVSLMAIGLWVATVLV